MICMAVCPCRTNACKVCGTKNKAGMLAQSVFGSSHPECPPQRTCQPTINATASGILAVVLSAMHKRLRTVMGFLFFNANWRELTSMSFAAHIVAW